MNYGDEQYDKHCAAITAEEARRRAIAGFKKTFELDPNGVDQHTPGAKLDSGKILAGILGDFSRALEEVAKVGTAGAQKYTRGGWQSVPDGPQRYEDAMWRHLLKSKQETHDADTGCLHAAQVIWNALACLELILREKGEL